MPAAKTSLISAIATCKCPRCRRGSMFTYNSWLPGKFHLINEHCPHCNLRLELEPGFFIGARYVSYAIMVALIVTEFVGLNLFAGDPNLYVYIAVIIPTLIITAPWVQRASQVVYMYLFGWVDYDASLDKPEADLT